MRIFILLITLFFSHFLHAQTVDIDFRQISLADFSTAVLKGMLQKNYIISPAVLTDDRKITVSVRQVPTDKIYEVFKSTLAGVNLDVSDLNGVYFINARPQSDLTAIGQFKQAPEDAINPDPLTAPVSQHNDYHATYRPKYRSSLYLSKIVAFMGGLAAEVGEGDFIVYSASTSKRLDDITKILVLSDTRPQSVLVKMAMLEFSQTTNDEKSFNFSAALDVLSARLSVKFASSGLSRNQAVFKGHNIEAVISALQGDTRFHYLSNPTIKVLDGEKASLLVGSEVPTRGQSSIDKNGNIIQSFEYRKAGMQITVEPRIKADFVMLKVMQEISGFVPTNTSNIDSPTINKRSAETVLEAKRGDVVILAGIDEDKETETVQGLKFLPKFLDDKTTNKSKSQILLLIEIEDV